MGAFYSAAMPLDVSHSESLARLDEQAQDYVRMAKAL